MQPNQIVTQIIRPFQSLVKKDKMGTIIAEHDRELTLKPVITKKSHLIAKSRYKSDYYKSEEAINKMSERD